MATTTPLTAPVAFYDDSPDWARRPATAIGLLVGGIAFVAAAFSLVGRVTARFVDGHVTVDNPDYPGDAFCSGPGPTPSGCAEPATIERATSSLVIEAFSSLGTTFSVAVLVGFVLALADVAAWAVYRDGDGSVGDSLVIVGWATVPWALALAALAVLLGVAVSADPTAATTAGDGSIVSVLGGLSLVGMVLLAAAAIASWFVCYGGLRGVHGLSDGWAMYATLSVVIQGIAFTAFVFAG